MHAHAFSRLQKFFGKFGRPNEQGKFVNLKYNDMRHRHILEYLFYRETKSVPDQELLQLMTVHLRWNGERLLDIDSNRYYKHIEPFYRYNETLQRDHAI